MGAQRVLAPFRRRLPALSATVVLIMGLLSMSGHLTGAPGDHAAHAAPAASAASAAPALDAETPHEH
jgi:hypothetical protein